MDLSVLCPWCYETYDLIKTNWCLIESHVVWSKLQRSQITKKFLLLSERFRRLPVIWRFWFGLPHMVLQKYLTLMPQRMSCEVSQLLSKYCMYPPYLTKSLNLFTLSLQTWNLHSTVIFLRHLWNFAINESPFGSLALSWRHTLEVEGFHTASGTQRTAKNFRQERLPSYWLQWQRPTTTTALFYSSKTALT